MMSACQLLFLCFIVVVLGALLVADIDEAMNKMSAGQLLEVGASLCREFISAC